MASLPPSKIGSLTGPSPTISCASYAQLLKTLCLEGFIGFGTTEFAAGFEQGESKSTALALHLDICIEDLDQFLTLPEHRATLQGSVECERLGGKRTIDRGTWRLLVDSGDITQKQIQYEMSFHDGSGGFVVLTAAKSLTDRSRARSWHEISTAYATLSRSVEGENRAQTAETIAAGIVKSSVLHDLEQVASIRVDAPTVGARVHALSRFGAFYFGRLWDVYARHVLPVAPF
jgi:cholesterol oxidase